MASDDILWQKVEKIKEQVPVTSSAQPAETPPAPSPQRPKPQPKPRPGSFTRKVKKRAVYLSDYHASKAASTIAEQPVPEQADERARQIEAVRQIVKRAGRDVAFVRLTPEEKRQLGDIVYSYKRQEIKTTENEVLRIALNFLLDEYETNGKESVLAQVIAALNA